MVYLIIITIYLIKLIIIKNNNCYFDYVIIIGINNYCGPEEFQCHDGKCLSIDKRCNGKKECNSGEDEVNCQHFDGFGTGIEE